MNTIISHSQKQLLKKIIKHSVEKPVIFVTDIGKHVDMIDIAYLINVRLLDSKVKAGLPLFVSLTPEGATYFARSHAETFSFLKRSVLIPAIVAFITTVLGMWIQYHFFAQK